MLQPTENTYLQRAYEEETEKLAAVVRHIEEQRIQLADRMPAEAAYHEAATEIQRVLNEQSDALHSALNQPYFGRLDYFHRDAEDSGAEPNGSEHAAMQTPKVIYLGIAHIPGHEVFSWTAPVGKLWYSQSYEDGYTAPKGYIPTKVDLKRYVRVRSRKLEALNDIFRRQLPAPATARQDVLTEALTGAGSDDGHLQVIVETIEPDQYENIANVSDKVLIVQGAAGSGKSEIGLHRIAYLLSPFNDIAEHERPTPSTTLFVGPSQAFIEYASDILPSLGVTQAVEQARFSEWLANGLSVKISFRPRVWNNLLAEGEMSRYDERAESFKGSLIMADVLDRHVAELLAEAKASCLRLPEHLPGTPPILRVSKDRIEALSKEVFGALPQGSRLNHRRADFIDRVARLLLPADQSGRRSTGWEAERRRAEVRNLVAGWCDAGWKEIDFRREYIALLSDTERMVSLSNSVLPTDVAEELSRSASRIERQGFDDSDLGALAYLDNLLNATVTPKYRHIVVDEAQDISPIEFKLLATSSVNNWFTVLGDTAQRLTPYRGIRRWRDVERVFGRSDIEVQPARRSYRSTRQITEFNNRILRTFDRNIKAPIPIEREGHRVEYNRHRNLLEMHEGIISDIDRTRALDGMEDAVIAVLVRDMRNLNRFRKYCRENDVSDIPLVDQERHSNARTVLARIPDVKGLEYDAVIVMGVNDSFGDTTFNKKLLYLATTRAKHYLAIHWSDKQSPILSAMSDRGVTWRRR